MGIIGVLFFLSLPVISQSGDFRFKHFSSNEGLSNSIIMDIEQDHLGYIWIGTSEGLNCFDGYTFKTFFHKLNDPESLPDNMIFDIYLDSRNRLWIGTQYGLCQFDYSTESFTSYMLDPERDNINTANRVTGIDEDSDHNLYATVELGGLFRFDEDTKEFIKDPHDFISVKEFVIDPDNGFWMGGVEGLTYYQPEYDVIAEFDTYKSTGEEVPMTDVNTIFAEGDTIWVGTILGRIFYLIRSSMELRMLDQNLENTYYIFDIFKSSEGLLYFSTTDGLFVYNKSTELYQSYTYDKDNPTGLNTRGVTCVFEDFQHNLWVGTYQGGVNLAVSGKSFRNYNYFSKPVALEISNINVVLEDRQGFLWLGSFDQGIEAIDPNTGNSRLFLHEEGDPSSLGFGSVYEIFEDSRGNIWVGTYLDYLQKLDKQTGRFTRYPFSPELGEESPGKDIRAIIEDEEGYLWMISHGFGVSKFNPVTGKFQHFRQNQNDLEHSLADNYPFHLLLDSEGIIWIATPSGLSRLDPSTEAFTNYYHHDGDSTSLMHNFINVLYEDSQNRLWIGTSIGLDMLDRQTGQFRHFYQKDGLAGNQVKAILEHNPNELWVSTGTGLSRMRLGTDSLSATLTATFRNYRRSDNLQDIFYWDRSACKLQSGELAFGGENGVVIFNPAQIKDNLRIPDVYLTGLALFNEPVLPGSSSEVLDQHIRYTDAITLDHDQNFITIEYVAINYISTESNSYRYRLRGFDEKWVEAGSSRAATFTNLDPGTYVFEVQASNNDNLWNRTGTAITIHVKSPYWESWWFITIMVLMVVGLGFFLYRYRVQLFKYQKIELEQRVEERTKALSRANEELVEKHNQIVMQNQEIINRHQEINAKNEEIEKQKQLLEKQKSQVENAYEELTGYRNKLEELVEERTRELIAAKDRAEESDQLKSSFLANLSHEIRTPLNSIIGFTTLLFDDDLNPDERNNYKSIIDLSTTSLLNLINDIIDFSKIESNDLKLKISEVRVTPLLDKLYDIYSLELKKQFAEQMKNLSFTINMEEELEDLTVMADEARLQQVLNNLINNAIKFTPQGGVTVSVRVYTEDPAYLEFEVADTGIGIPPEFTGIIFDRFRKIEVDKTRLYRGTGLGLTISQALVEMMGGHIWVQSEVDKGSRFFFTLPKEYQGYSQKTQQKETEHSIIPALENTVILVAEDDFANYMYLEKLLRKTRARVIHALNGKQVLDLFNRNPDINLVLMDIKMPEMDGMEALSELRKKDLTVPVIAQTAYAFSDEVKKIREAGFHDYIAKPINSNDLFRLLYKYLPGRNSHG